MTRLAQNQAGLDAIVEGVVETVIPEAHIKVLGDHELAVLHLGDTIPTKYLVEKQFTLKAQSVEELVESLTDTLTVELAKTLNTQSFRTTPEKGFNKHIHTFYFTYRPLVLLQGTLLACLTCSLTAITITQP